MSNIVSISIKDFDLAYCKENSVGKSKLFADAIELHRRLNSFLDNCNEPELIGHCTIIEYYHLMMAKLLKIQTLQKELIRRNETIEALQDVLAREEINKRRGLVQC